MTNEMILNCVGEFTWMFGFDFFVETEFGNFIWKDPDYNGNNEFKLVGLTYKQYCQYHPGVGYGRDKGKHIIKEYCGENIKIIM